MTDLQHMSRLLYSLLIRRRSFTVLDPLRHSRILLVRDATQFPRQNEYCGEMHHRVRNGHLIPEQELPRATLQSLFQQIHIVDHILRHTGFGLCDIAILLVPAGVEDRNTMESPCAFCGMDILQRRVPFRVAQRREELVRLVILVA